MVLSVGLLLIQNSSVNMVKEKRLIIIKIWNYKESKRELKTIHCEMSFFSDNGARRCF